MGVTPFDSLTSIPGMGEDSRVHGGVAVSRLRGSFVTFVETLRLSVDALRAHKLRSFLTLLGVILAVTTLVAVIAIEPGMKTDIVVVTPTCARNAVRAKSSSCLERTGFVVYGST